MLNIDINYNFVIIRGVRVDRPPNISPSDWMAYWERAERFRVA